ncbi:ComEC/Rec2 family competence protein [Streptomyces sp. UNOB3_S3]|uniref:ComEC/Rec2 family competence protein n=1 Tax=Streptomyces sp. UNOB3_S3 TaxID=2871682 RepID=UPI001E2C1F89|nr:ComEC/Rec2 family competence protein [Streptomyces sp. UNOB3_S3]MCC3776203.1 ComEC/Rec2 family competence protein [Streptomyces sp. UNOB3_S3]
MTRAAVTDAGRDAASVDLRLVGPALAAWAAAAAALTMEGRTVAIACGAAVLTSCVLLVVTAVRRGAGGGGRTGTPGRAGMAGRVGVAGAVAAVLLCAAAGAAAGALAGADTRRGPVPELARRHAEATVEARVTGDPRATRPRVRGSVRAAPAVVVEAEATRVTTTRGVTTEVRTPVLLMVHQSWLGLLPSTELRVDGRLMPPSRPGDRVAAVVRVGDSGPPRVVAGPSLVQRAAGRLRAGLREAADGLAPDARALLPGLVVGDTSRVPSDLEEAFRATDLTHLLAVSGGNLAVLLAVLVGPPHLASRAERRGLAARLGIPLRLTAVLGGGLALGFVVVCRPEPSVLRAAVCGLITLLAIGTGRRRGLLPALAGAVLLLVLYDPWLARSYGFLLSVLATGALLTLAPRWAAALRRRGVPPRIAEALAAAGAAQAVCAPVIAVLAARVSLVAVPCNLLAEPAVAPATVLGFAALAAAPLAPPLAEGLAWLAGWPARWTATVARTGAGLPGAELDWPGGWAGGLWLAAATVVVLLAAGRVLRGPWVCGACALALLLAVVRPAPLTRGLTGWPPPDWRMVACDVGQGDALVLATGPHSAVLVDAGPEPRAVDRCLRRLGVDEVPLLLLSHCHADHVDGLPGVLRGRAVGAIETTPYALPPGQAAFVRREARRAGVPVVEAVPGERRRVGGLSWEVLWPPPAGTSAVAEDGPNDASVVLLVRTGGLTFLLLGDLEPPAQQELWETHPGLPPVDVLKVAHHGSAYQDPRLTRGLHPRLAVISVGAGNPYGHPAARTIGALREQGAAVLRTDTDGPVAVTGGRDGPVAVAGRRRSRGRGDRPAERPRRSRTVDRCRALPVRGITESCTQRTSTPTSVTSTPPARPPPPRRRYGTFSSAISWRCPSRTSRSTSVRRSCWRAGPWWTRWCTGGGEATATRSTARSRSC